MKTDIKNKIRHLKGTAAGCISLLCTLLLCSCGEILDIPETIKPTSMTLDRHRLVVMAGDSVLVNALFEPEELSNLSVWWHIPDEQTATVHNGMVKGVQLGTTVLYAKSVLNQIEDSCSVIVIDNWDYFKREFYRYDMVVYARPLLADGTPIPAGMLVAALCGDEVRGIGIPRNRNGISYMELRIYSNQPSGEIISFVAYQPGEGSANFVQTIAFDEEAHGTLTNLLTLTLQ